MYIASTAQVSLVINDNDFVIVSQCSGYIYIYIFFATTDATEFRVHEYFSWLVDFWSEDFGSSSLKLKRFNSRAKEGF